jgi:hypothetical protein
MSTDKKPEDQITEAGAVELDEAQLDDAAGGIIAVAPTSLKISSPELKISSLDQKVGSLDLNDLY